MTAQRVNPTSFEQQSPQQSQQSTGSVMDWSALIESYWADYKVTDSEVNGAQSINLSQPTESVTFLEGRDDPESRLVNLPKRVSLYDIPATSFHALQEWEGYVIAVGHDTFTARLTDLTAGEQQAGEEVELSIDEVNDDDRGLLNRGRIFRWAIGYERSRAGTKKRVSHLVFRRLPKWTERELAAAEEEGRRLAEAIDWD